MSFQCEICKNTIMRQSTCVTCEAHKLRDATMAMLERENVELRDKLDAAEKVINAARASVANPAWAGVADEDVELERVLAEYDGYNAEAVRREASAPAQS